MKKTPPDSKLEKRIRDARNNLIEALEDVRREMQKTSGIPGKAQSRAVLKRLQTLQKRWDRLMKMK